MELVIFVLVATALFIIVPFLVLFYAMVASERILGLPIGKGAILVNAYGLLMVFLIGLLYAALDGEWAVSLSPICLLPFIPYAAVFGLLLAYRRPNWFKVGVTAIIVLFPLAIRPINWGTYKPFLRQFQRVETGMTIQQVEAIMAGFSAEKGTRFRTPVCPESGNSISDTECARYYAPQSHLDRAMVTFRDGRVIRVYYDND